LGSWPAAWLTTEQSADHTSAMRTAPGRTRSRRSTQADLTDPEEGKALPV
jgi:hypothetical protein